MTSDLIRRTVNTIQPAGPPELRQRIASRLDHLTKPPGSLGRLEELALRYGLARGTEDLVLEHKKMLVFCADHGVAAAGVSAYPSDVTRQMVRNFVRGGAAISVLCRQFAIETVIVDMGVAGPPEPGALDRKIGQGARNWLLEPAMSAAQAVQSIEGGIALAQGADIFGVGEMGIGNTTAAAALLCAFTGIEPELAVGRGTGVGDEALRRKAEVVRKGLALHAPGPADPVGALAAVGGFEIGGMCGLLLGAAARRCPVVVDGFIAGSAALVAQALAPRVRDYLFFAHLSAESGHARMLEFLGAQPLLSLGMRLGEGTGAALAINLLDSSVRLYREMATFTSAGVSGAEVTPVDR